MKRFVKTLSLLLALLLFLGALASCAAKEEAPEGMKAANVYGDDFRLYVPMTWTLNTNVGYAGAYADMTQQSGVSAVKYLRTEALLAEMTAAGATDAAGRMAWFWENECLPTVAERALGGEIVMDETVPADTVLGGCNAKQYVFRATVGGNKLRIRQVVVERTKVVESGEEIAYYVLTFMTLDSIYDLLKDAEAEILGAFAFSGTPYDPQEYQKPGKEDGNAPEGMRLASNKDVAYEFYVPTDWFVTVDDEIFSAYDTEDRANVSVIPYQPEMSMSVPVYFTESEERMKLLFGDRYEYIGHEETTLGGRKAHKYFFAIENDDGVLYRYCQVIGAYKGMLYSLTLTATDATYEGHLAEFGEIVAAFRYR